MEPKTEPDQSRPEKEWRLHGTILLVDDVESLLEVAQRMLEHLGFTALAASSGQEAIRIFRTAGDRIDGVILDLAMPEMGGEEAFDELRRMRPNLPIILSSGYQEQEVSARFAGKNPSAFIQKPYELSNLRAALRKALK